MAKRKKGIENPSSSRSDIPHPEESAPRPPASPPHPLRESRKEFVVALSLDEREALQSAATRKGLPLATWIRMVSLNAAREEQSA